MVEECNNYINYCKYKKKRVMLAFLILNFIEDAELKFIN